MSCHTFLAAGQPPRVLTRSAIKSAYWRLRREPAVLGHFLLLLWRVPMSATRLFMLTRISHDRRPILVIALLEHMGDIMAAEPIARLARRSHPDRRILWVTRKPYAPLAAAFADVEDVFTVSCLTEWLLLWRAGIVRTVWDLHFDQRACPRCGVALEKKGPTVDNYYFRGNLLAGQCESAGLPPLLEGPVLAPSRQAAAMVGRLALPPRFVAVHCTSNERERDWIEERWQELVARVTHRLEIPVVEIGSVSLLAHAGIPIHDLCGRLSIIETAEVIRRAALFIGVDSGPAHLANAVGTPGVIVLGKYRDFDRHLPYSGGYADGSNADLVYADGPAATLEVDVIFQAVLKRLSPYGAEQSV